MTVRDKRIARAERLLRTAKALLLEVAREQGAGDPYVFVEPESGIYVCDRAHPDDNANDGPTRQKAVVGSGTDNEMYLRVHFEAGAW